MEHNGGCHRWEHFYPATFKVKYAFQRGRASVQKNDSHQSVFRLCSISTPEVPSVVLPCTHQTEHCREPGHENSAGFSLKACVPNAKSLSWHYRSWRWSFPRLCNKSSGGVLQRSLLCVKGCTPGQAVLVFPDRAAGPNKEEAGVRGPSPPGTHPTLRESTCARQEWEDFSPVSCLPLPPNKNRLPHPCSYQTWQRTYNLKKIKTVPLEKK